MRKLFLPVGLGACVLLAIIFAARGCRLSDEAAAAKLKYDTYRALTIQEREQMNQRVVVLQADIVAKDAEIAVHKQVVFKKNEQMAQKNGQITELERKYSTLSTDVLKIVNLTQQVNEWKGQFSLAQDVIATQEKIIGALEMKFTTEVSISDEFCKALAREESLRKLAEQRIVVLEKDNKKFRFGSRVKTILVIGAAGFVGYSLLPKGK